LKLLPESVELIYEISIDTTARTQFKDITEEIKKIIIKSGEKSGVCYIFIPHTTAGVTINENADPSVVSDLSRKLSSLIPVNDGYDHREGNSDAHLKASLAGFCQTVLIEEGLPVLGTWQGIYFCEFDGPRKRRIIIKIV
jgi:secondary thiamine-phosphate synthase enzyme